MKWLPTCLCALFLTMHFFSFSQERCGFDILHGKKMKTDASYRKKVEELEKNIKAYIGKNKNRLAARITTTTAALYTIPVVVHVIHTGGSVGSIYNPSDAQIQGTINYLNQVFNGTYPGIAGAGDLQIQFALAVRDPNCNATNGIDRVNGSALPNYTANGVNAAGTTGTDEINLKNLIRWNPSDFYNIWIVNKIDGLDGTSGTFVGGFAWMPGVPFEYDGTVMLATQMQAGRKTLPHEIGHAFGLYHPFEGGDATTCANNVTCNAQGDYVCDTDPITTPSAFTCRTGTNTCIGSAYNNNTEHNFMNYTNCYDLFTMGQKARMLAAAAGIFRISLSNSSALIATNIANPFINPLNPSCGPATNAMGLSSDYAGILNIQVNNKTYNTLTPFLDDWFLNATAAYVNTANECLKLVQLSRGGIYNFSANVVDANTHQLRAWIDYNNDGIFNNMTEQIHFNSSFGTGQSFTTSTTFTVPHTATENTVLRLRVIDDLVPGFPGAVAIGSGCHTPHYGQAEDFPVYIASAIILPVTLLNFTGDLENNKVVLTWSTSNEEGSKNFEVEKSTDGSNYYLVGKLNASGNSIGINTYSFNDMDVEETNFYRIRINDKNGQSKLSRVIVVDNKGNKQYIVLIKNPFNKVIDLQIAKGATLIKLQLINASGSMVAQKEFRGGSQIHWQIPDAVSSGIYILRAMVDGKISNMKIIKE